MRDAPPWSRRLGALYEAEINGCRFNDSSTILFNDSDPLNGVPILGTSLALWVMRNYDLNEAQSQEIRRKLDGRKAAAVL